MMIRVSRATLAAFIVSVAGCWVASAISCNAGEQLAQAPSGEACAASVARPHDAAAANNAATFEAPTPGTRYLLGKSGYFQIASVDGMTVKTVNASKQPATWFAGMIYAANRIDQAAAEAIWPLEIGKTVTFREETDKDAWCHTVKVVRAEPVDVPAGTFAAVVIEDRMRSLAAQQHPVDVTVTYWYAPGARWVVKREVKQASGPPFRKNWTYALTQIVNDADTPRLAPHWAKIDCGDAHIDVPFAQKGDCYRGPIGKGDDGTCHVEHYGTVGRDGTLTFEIYLSLAGGHCGIYLAGDDVDAYAKSATGLSSNGKNFSSPRRFGSAHVVSFTATGNKPLDCFAFAIIGPNMRRSDSLYRYTMRGHVCRTDGTKLGDADIERLARGVSVD